MDWGTLVATLSGGSIAISGTVLADYLRHRREGERGVGARRRAVYLEFISAAEACFTQLRHLAQTPGAEPDLAAATRAALRGGGIQEVRERLFVEGSTRVAGAGQAMYEHLRALRRAVATGAGHSSPVFHEAYHPYIAAVWAYRVAVREELEGQSLTPAAFGWRGWDGRDRCPVCTRTAVTGT
ncbi:CchlQ [Streptomyces crystallinus]|uniref:CchlQ n=1 Tax=Streptomyces crystallinus TaxID=68191 RepID=A0ABP3QCE8_9ACTN